MERASENGLGRGADEAYKALQGMGIFEFRPRLWASADKLCWGSTIARNNGGGAVGPLSSASLEISRSPILPRPFFGEVIFGGETLQFEAFREGRFGINPCIALSADSEAETIFFNFLKGRLYDEDSVDTACWLLRMYRAPSHLPSAYFTISQSYNGKKKARRLPWNQQAY